MEETANRLQERLTGLSGRAVGMRYGGISASAVSNRVRQSPEDSLPIVERLQVAIRQTEVAATQSEK